MFRSKRDVDKHVQDLLKKTTNENERKGLGFSFAKYYHQVGEHKIARQHLAGYLAAKESSAPGHRLAGQIAEALNEKESAFRSYKRCFDIDPNQRDLVFKICSLICEFPASPANRDIQQCWLERAEALQPHHSVVFELKQRLLLASNSQVKGEVMEDQLKSEMVAKPADMKLRIHLLKLYIDSSRVKEAYEHMAKIEALQVFSQEVDWYECVLNVLEAFQQASSQKIGPEFYHQMLNALDRLAFLKVSHIGRGQKTSQVISDVVSTLNRLDESLQQASINGVSSDVLVHFTCQLYYMAGLVLVLKAQAGQEDETQVLGYVATLFAIAYNQGTIPSGSRCAERKLVDAWIASGMYRQSQCGHCIVAWETREGRKWIVDTIKRWDNMEGRRRIFEVASSSSRSTFAEKLALPRSQLELPSFADLLDLDQTAVQLNANELHPVVWLGRRYFTMHRRLNETDFASDFSLILGSCRFVRDIPFSTASWNSSAPETLCALDIEAFVYAAIYSSVSLDDGSDSKGLGTVPASLTRSLCTDLQSAWWQATVKLISGSAKEHLGDLRRTMQRGLEVIRLTGNHHGIPPELVAKLARTFMSRAGKARVFPTVDVPAPISTDVLSVEQTEALEIQSGRYWKVFLEMVSSGNRFIPPMSGRLFEYRSTDIDLDAIIKEAKLFTGYHLWRSGRREEGNRELQSISDPYASYYQGLLFKEMADEELRKGATVYESRSAANVLLNKSRDAFYLTLDRLRSPGMERFHPLDQKLAEVIERVETKLGSLTNLSVVNGHSTDEGGEDEENESEEREFLTPQQVTSTPHRRSLAAAAAARTGVSMHSRLMEVSGRVEARPSPERLDAQLRQMVHQQEEFNQAISSELKEIRGQVVDIKSLIQKLITDLENQAKIEVRGSVKASSSKKESAEKVSEAGGYEDDVEEWDEEDEEEEEEEEETDLDTLVKLKGKLKSSSASLIPPSSLPVFPPPFPGPATNRGAYAFQAQGYGSPFQNYPGYPGFQGYLGPAGGYPLAPGYGYLPGMSPWEMGQAASPGSPFIPAMGIVAPQMQPQVPLPMTQQVTPQAAQPPSANTSVFNRLGVAAPAATTGVAAKDTSTPLLAATLQQPVINDVTPSTTSSGAPHAYQINVPTHATPEKVMDSGKLVPAIQISTGGLLASIPEPQYSSVTSPEKTPSKAGRDRKPSSCSDGSYAPEEEVDNFPDFKPIIPLPEEVEVKTGEEGEEILFDQRAKLYRFDGGEWKERGVGQLKLLKDPNTKKVRLIMRRDQVLKICANHHVTADIKLSPMTAASNSWIWAAMDFADGEGRLEKFAVRFKTPEQATDFKNVFEKAAREEATNAKSPANQMASTSDLKTSSTLQGFGNQFVPKAGTWACALCYVNNLAEVTACVACETPKPGANVPSTKSTAVAPSTTIKFGMPSSAAPSASTASFTALNLSAKTTPSTGFTFGSTPAATPTSGIKFGTTPTTTATTPTNFGFSSMASTTASPSSSSSTVSKPTFSFSLPAAAASPAGSTVPSTKAPFTFSPPKLTTSTASSSLPAKTNGQNNEAHAPIATTTTSVFSNPTKASDTPFSGFTFGSLGKTSETLTKPALELSATEVKPSPFSGFSFQGSTEKKPETGMLFSLLAQQTSSPGFTISPNTEFPGSGAPLFNKVSSTQKAGEKDGEGGDGDDNEAEGEEYEPNVAFEPVIPLPALIEVSTGEEEESVLFSDRGFLYRFVPDTKEWKEKGRGDMKILQHKTSGRVRLLMRREQVLKVCCNHTVTANLVLKPLQTSDRTWTWSAQDFSEGELVNETFALKFKTQDQAQKFKKVFEEAQQKSSISEQPIAVDDSTKAGVSKVNNSSSQQASTKSLADMFKPKEGSWECKGCYSRNSADVIKCPSCETLKPGVEAPPTVTPTQPSSSHFGAEGGFKFGAAATPTTATASSGFSSFGTTPTATTPFGSGFNFSLTPSLVSPNRSQAKTGRSPNVSVSSENEYYEEEAGGDDIHFEPVIPLPEKIQVKTGEEEEEVMYCHRAKLFRLDNNEWKERGLGDIKILRHKTSDKTRLLMRREQILKICLNHALSSDILFKEKDEKSWMWAAQDYSDDEGRKETFVVRFRDAEISKQFMAAIQRTMDGASSATSENSADHDEVELLYAKEATQEQKRKAIELKLPLNFFTYENAPPCPGCRGCELDGDDSLPTTTTTPSAVTASSLKPNSTPATPWMKMTDPTVSTLSFSSLTTTSSSGFNKPAEFSWSGTGRPIFGVVGAAAAANTSQPEEKSNVEDENEEVPENDPHFEPIIPLPALVEVKTGEENEELTFSHRAKLYRFESSTKEWKEKGVGDIKILHHKEKNTFRVLLRRDQIHKLACNHYITLEMDLKPLSTSTTAWSWFAMDFSTNELLSEHFAVRFKLEETAKLFQQKFLEGQTALRGGAQPSSCPATAVLPVSEPVVVTAVTTESEKNSTASSAKEAVSETEEEAEAEQDEEDYEDVEESIMFEKRCTLSYLESEGNTWILLGTGLLKIIYDDEMLCARIVVEDSTYQLLCDNVVAIETELKLDGKECVWSAIDYSTEESGRRTFRAQFSSAAAALEFQSIFSEAKQFAEKSDVHDEPDLAAVGYDHSNDDEGGYDEGTCKTVSEAASTTSSVKPPTHLIRACDPNLAKALSDIFNDFK